MPKVCEDNEFNCECLLLKQKIDEGACYDINAVVEKWVIREIIDVIERQLEVKIDAIKAEHVCPTCNHYPFKHIIK